MKTIHQFVLNVEKTPQIIFKDIFSYLHKKTGEIFFIFSCKINLFQPIFASIIDYQIGKIQNRSSNENTNLMLDSISELEQILTK